MVNEGRILEGYRKTEIGLLPNDWDVDEIQNQSDISTGSKNTQDSIPDGAYPFFVRSQTVERINSYSFDGEAVLTAGDGVKTGKVFHYINGKFDFHQRVYKVSNFSDRLDGYFFFLYFSKNFYNRIIQLTAKSSVDSVRRDMIAKMLVPLPPKPEQDIIASYLKDINNLITELENLIAKKKMIKLGAIQILFEPKNEWEVKRIDEIFDVSAGGDYKKAFSSNVKSNKYPYPIYSNSLENNGLYGYSSYFTNQENCITVTARGTIGKAYYRGHKFTAIGRLLVLKPKIDVNCFYISEYINNNINFVLEVTGVPQLTVPKISEYDILLPKIKLEQDHIAEVLLDMDVEIELLKVKLDKFKMIQQGMMQNLLTGKIRLV